MINAREHLKAHRSVWIWKRFESRHLSADWSTIDGCFQTLRLYPCMRSVKSVIDVYWSLKPITDKSDVCVNTMANQRCLRIRSVLKASHFLNFSTDLVLLTTLVNKHLLFFTGTRHLAFLGPTNIPPLLYIIFNVIVVQCSTDTKQLI